MVDVLCFSHLRWDFVYQRPQHLLTRAARTHRVTVWEEPVWVQHGTPGLELLAVQPGLDVARPTLPWGADHDTELRTLLDAHLARRPPPAMLWFYTPQALTFAGHLQAPCVVYDCMDELAAFAGANPHLPELERDLMARSDLVFTGGRALFEAKRHLHPAIHAFPSGVDTGHFGTARATLPDPARQAAIRHPRAGYYGVIDERIDLALLAETASRCPDVHFVMVGPTAKIDRASLPRAANLHWLGPASYAELPAFLSNWDVAIMPFALNAATRFISPTKTPEYLAGGCPVVSTPVPDVVRSWSGCPGVLLADGAAAFAGAVHQAIRTRPETWRHAADAMLAGLSWDGIWSRMHQLIERVRPRAAAD